MIKKLLELKCSYFLVTEHFIESFIHIDLVICWKFQCNPFR